MYSQRDEEKVILEHLPATGRFLDIGAYSLQELSNTRALAERGWSGVLIEPCPDACNNLIQQVKSLSFKDLEIVNAVVTPDYEGLVKFYASQHAVSSVNEAHVAVWKACGEFSQIWSAAISVRMLLQKFPPPFQFISIDCEGVSYEILSALNLQALGCQLVCIEMDQNEAALRDHFLFRGYSVIHKTAENLIAKRN